MTTKFYLNNELFIAGTTLKTPQLADAFNMALHTTNNPSAVVQNRQKLATLLQKPIQNFVCANQTHSAHFYKVTTADMNKGAITMETAIPDTDALYTFENGPILTSFSADCVPVIIYSEVDGLAAVVHSGWQGTVKEITYKLLSHLKNVENCSMEHIHVIIATALSQEKFEVDIDVYERFKALGYAEPFMYFNEHTNKYHIDNQRTIQKQCELAGILPEHITIDTTCTFQSPTGFSYRQDRQAGRHCTFILKK